MVTKAGTLFLCVLITAAFTTNRSVSASGESDHEKWVASALREMQSVKVGMKRSDLKKVFATEGGLAQTTHRTYVYKGCAYFKADVEFSHDSSSGTGEENDRITSISTPYLAWPIQD
jgi:hypothetical protein